MINTKNLKEKLHKRGWDKHSINRTLHVLDKAEKTRSKHSRQLDKYTFVTFILVFLAASLAIFIGTLPVLIKVPSWFSIIVISILGLCLGSLSDQVLGHMHFDHRHYIFMLFFLPLSSLAMLFIIFGFTKTILTGVGIYLAINPVFVAVAYALSFSIPHIIKKIKEQK